MLESAGNTIPEGERVGFGWNEIQFLEADELRRMAPAIVGLEMRRLTSACQQVEPGSSLYNMLVTARYELRQFLETLQSSKADRLQSGCVLHLDSALMNLGLCKGAADGDVLGVVEYALDRMSHIRDRMKLLY